MMTWCRPSGSFAANAGLPDVALPLLAPIARAYCPRVLSHADLCVSSSNDGDGTAACLVAVGSVVGLSSATPAARSERRRRSPRRRAERERRSRRVVSCRVALRREVESGRGHPPTPVLRPRAQHWRGLRTGRDGWVGRSVGGAPDPRARRCPVLRTRRGGRVGRVGWSVRPSVRPSVRRSVSVRRADRSVGRSGASCAGTTAAIVAATACGGGLSRDGGTPAGRSRRTSRSAKWAGLLRIHDMP